MSRSAADQGVVSTNTVIRILITGVVEALTVIKMNRVAIAIFVLSVVIAGNSLTVRVFSPSCLTGY